MRRLLPVLIIFLIVAGAVAAITLAAGPGRSSVTGTVSGVAVPVHAPVIPKGSIAGINSAPRP
jgi:hypothetical protein